MLAEERRFLFHCRCGALVYYRREPSGARLLCEYDHRFIRPGAGEACGLDREGAVVRGSWCGAAEQGAVEVTPYHYACCPAWQQLRERQAYLE